MKNNEKVLLGILTGLAAGAIIGTLVAPHKGSKTRKMIKDQGKKVVDDLRGKIEEGKQGFNSLKKEVIHAVKEAVCMEPAASEMDNYPDAKQN